MVCWPQCYFTFSHRGLATVRLILIFAYIRFGCAYVHSFVHGPGHLATVFGHIVFLWPRHSATLFLATTRGCTLFDGRGIWPHVVYMARVFGHILLYGQGIWPPVVMAMAVGHIVFHGQSIWSIFVFMTMVFGRISFYGHGIWPNFVLWPWHLATLYFMATVFGLILFLWPLYFAKI